MHLTAEAKQHEADDYLTQCFGVCSTIRIDALSTALRLGSAQYLYYGLMQLACIIYAGSAAVVGRYNPSVVSASSTMLAALCEYCALRHAMAFKDAAGCYAYLALCSDELSTDVCYAQRVASSSYNDLPEQCMFALLLLYACCTTVQSS
jgi:hypothetical protein